MLVAYEELLNICTTVLVAAGVPEDEARLQARMLVEADARQHPSHGIQRLPVIVERLRVGLAVPNPVIRAQWRGGALRVDGGRGLGPVVAMRAIDELCERVGTAGVVAAAISNSNHIGTLFPYVERIARDSFVGIAMTTSEALVHPWGGKTAMIGTNPIAIAVPAEPMPLVIDMATGSISMGKIIDHFNRKVPLQLGWAIDESGLPTVDPESAKSGAITPFGGPKGYALGVAIEAFVASLSGAALGREVTGTLDTVTVSNKGDVFISLDPDAFGMDGIAQRLGSYLDALRSSPPQDPEIAVMVPGDRSRLIHAKSLREGILLNDGVWQEILALTKARGQEAGAI